MLQLDPNKRITALDCYRHPHFWELQPPPCFLSFLPIPKKDYPQKKTNKGKMKSINSIEELLVDFYNI